ncbi:MAG: AI-2E family transporter [Gammaproteobacteria bacterium]|nr:AI-2E family transporter [Gammaproteobacteria bacterium]MDH5309953.1 AI-2E family transporter [Gammaproteobacteria bacterium]
MIQFPPDIDQGFQANAMASFLRIGAILLLITICYQIVEPFVSIVAWAMIISVSVHPLYRRLAARLGGREKLAAVVLVLCGSAILLVPCWLLADSTISGLRGLAGQFQQGRLQIPPPAESVAEWPLVGDRLYSLWSLAATSLQDLFGLLAPKLQGLGQRALGAAGGAALVVVQFLFSIVIAGALLPGADGAYRTASAAAVNLLGGERGTAVAQLVIDTIRSVTKGVLGVALIQAVLAGIGLVVMDVPAAGLWTFAVLLFAIVQLPALIVLGPIAVWVFSVGDPVPATIFAVYALLVSISDSVLKPLLLGRGLDVPMLVILVGAIGGALWAGIIGLFVGSVALALGYNILSAWIGSSTTASSVSAD